MKCPRCGNQVPEESSFCMHCGRSLMIGTATDTQDISGDFMEDPLLTFDPGESFGKRYKIVRELGRGGMGRVYEAEDRELGITVALKMIHPVFLSNEKMVDRFKKEILLARQITHHNVVRIHDFGEIQKTVMGQAQRIKFITMQFIDGKNLKEIVLKSGALQIERLINIFIQICRGLRSAHQGGIIHRDLKPQNIMVDGDDKVYITDFGLAKSLDGPELSASGSAIGTPEYISPEQANGEKVDRRSDIYNLGLILYEMAAGRRVYNAETVVGFLQKHMKEKPDPPSRFNPEISASLENIILKCLEKDPRKRYQDADELLNVLKDFRGDRRSLIPPYIARKIRKYALWSLLLVPLAGIIFLTRGTWIKLTLPPVSLEKRAPIAVLAFQNNTGDEAMDYWQKALPDLLQSDISQSRYFRVLSDERLHGILSDLKLKDVVQFSPDNLRAIADRGRVGHVITGSYVRGGQRLQINVKILEPKRGQAVETISVSGASQESVFSMINQITREIKRRFGLTPYEITADLDKDVEQITTQSPKALQYYIEGKQLYWKGKYAESIKKLEGAVKLDPKFTMAYYQLWNNNLYLGYPDKASLFLQLALKGVNQVSEREKFQIQGSAAFYIDHSFKKAKEYYDQWAVLYPDDIDAISYLGAVYRNAEEWEQSISQWDRLLQIDPRSEIAIENKYNSLISLGRYDEARRFFKNNENYFKNRSIYHFNLSWGYLSQGDMGYALAELEKAATFGEGNIENTMLFGKIHYLRGDLDDSRKFFNDLQKSEAVDVKIQGLYWLSQLTLLEGKKEETLDYINRGIEASFKNNLFYDYSDFLVRKGFLYLGMNRHQKMLEISSKIIDISEKYYYPRNLIQGYFLKNLSLLKLNRKNEFMKQLISFKQYIEEKINQKHICYYEYLCGALAESEGDWEKACLCYKNGYQLLSMQSESNDVHAFFLYGMGRCLYRKNDLDGAIQYYEEILQLTLGRLVWGDIYTKSLYFLGLISQMKGWEGKAIEYYEKFLQLWENSDYPFRGIQEAKDQLETLRRKPA